MSNKKVGITVPSSLGSGLSFASTIKDRLENIYGYDVRSYPVENVEYQKNAMDAIVAWGADHMIVWPCLPADAIAEKLAYFYEQGGKSFVIREYVSGVSGYCNFVMPDYFAAGVRLGYAFISAFDFENLGVDLTTADLTDVQKRYIYIALAGSSVAIK